jgi:hypothetical protein
MMSDHGGVPKAVARKKKAVLRKEKAPGLAGRALDQS